MGHQQTRLHLAEFLEAHLLDLQYAFEIERPDSATLGTRISFSESVLSMWLNLFLGWIPG